MKNSFKAWMLPEGVVEALPEEAKKLNKLSNTALTTFSRWGYQPLRPPIMEYADTFVSVDRCDDLVEQTMQFKDQKSGKQLGFRADMTPQVARIDAHYLVTDKVSRYAYAGEVVRSYPTGHGSARNPTMVGAELLGSASQQADIEIVSLLIAFLHQLELPQLTIELGNVDVVIELLNCVGIDEAQVPKFFEAFAHKDKERLERLCENNQLNDKLTSQLIALIKLYGDVEILEEASLLFADQPTVLLEIERLKEIATTLVEQYPTLNFHIDLADVHGYGYHNGLIFSAYVEGVWKAIAQGGRYDSFGSDLSENYHLRPSTGFSCDLSLIASLLPVPESDGRTIMYSERDLGDDAELIHSFIAYLRAKGDTVIECFDDDIQPYNNCLYQLVKSPDGFSVVEI